MASSVPEVNHRGAGFQVNRSTTAFATVLVAFMLSACASSSPGSEIQPATTLAEPTFDSERLARPAAQPTTSVSTTQPPDPSSSAAPQPDWLGSRVLPTTPDGLATPQTTPKELVDRQLITVDTLPPPSSDAFVGQILPVDNEVAERSTWNPDCPVSLDQLRYLRLSFWGFDGLHHQGEMIVHADSAEDVVQVFGQLHEARFPIEEMRVVTNEDVAAKPTGDGNNTASFVCRNVTNGSSFSQHAFGLAIDINPFHNPYQRGALVLPELSTAYLDRDGVRAGMVTEGDVVHRAFTNIGWTWGGNWRSLKDYQHFSANGK